MDDLDRASGPTIEYTISRHNVCRAIDYLNLIAMAMEESEEGEVRVKLDLNGINFRPYDMSFVPMIIVRK